MEKDLLNQILDSIKTLEKKIDNKIDTLDKKFDNKIDILKDEFNIRFTRIENELITIKNSTLVMEIEHGNKIDLLLEMYCPNYEQHVSFDLRLSEVESKVEQNSFELSFLRESKQF